MKTISPWAQERRLDFIDYRLSRYGRVNRADIKHAFGVTHAIASKDIQEYMRRHPEHIRYDTRRKSYFSGANPLPARWPLDEAHDLTARVLCWNGVPAYDGNH